MATNAPKPTAKDAKAALADYDRRYPGQNSTAGPARMTAVPAAVEAATHRAIGWLTTAVENEHPGFLDTEAKRSNSVDPEVSALFTSWATDAKAMQAR